MSPEELEQARCLMESHEALKKQTGRALLAHIDAQAKQVATLKAALRQDRIERLLSDAGRFGIALDVGTAHRMAREQLAREMPEIFGEDEI